MISVLSKIKYYIDIFTIRYKWYLFSFKKNALGISNTDYGKEMIVSLTSYPARIQYVSKTIQSIMIQRVKPNRIILWLGYDKFINKEKDLPKKLLDLRKYGLEIKWCKDLRSYTKLIPALKEFPNAIIITVDDDIYYRESMIEQLIHSYKINPSFIWAHRVTKIELKDGDYRAVPGGEDTWKKPSFLHKLTGVGGVLYPPDVFFNGVLDEEIFENICATNDDIWFWLMAVLNKIKIAQVSRSKSTKLLYVSDSQKGPALSKINDANEKLFWKDFNNMLRAYPEVDTVLRKEYATITAEVLNGSKND